MNRTTNPGSQDGKPIGTPGSATTLRDPLPGPIRFRGLRRRRFAGSASATAQLAAHARKWADRKMSVPRIAERLGISRRDVEQLLSPVPFNGTPRLRGGDGEDTSK